MPKELIKKDSEKIPKIVYHPKGEETTLDRLRKVVEEKYSLKFNDYWEFHEWSCKNYPEFWGCVWHFFEIVHSKPYTQVYDRKNGFDNMRWFIGAEINFAQNLLKYRDSKTAIIATDAEDNIEYISYKDLYDEVGIYVKAMKDEGIRKGDIVACYMSNKVEAVFAFLATAAIGAIFCGTLPLLGVKAVLSRFKQIKPKILFTSGNFKFQNIEYNMDERIREIVGGLPCLQKVVFCPKKGKKVQENISDISKCVYVQDFLRKSREDHRENPQDIEFEQLPFDHPLIISFTSGTTGVSKGLSHPTGLFITGLRDLGLHQNCTRDDVIFNQTPVGWACWVFTLNAMHLGVTAVYYEGCCFYESPTRFYDLIDKFGVTLAWLRSSVLETIETYGRTPTSKHSLKTLKRLLPVGSPAKPSTFDFITEKIKPGLICSPTYGCTELQFGISGIDSNMPIYRGEIQAPSLGTDVRIIDETGNPAMGKRGVLVLANPQPSLPVAMINDEDKEKVRDAYLREYPGYWNISDDAWRNPVTKGIIVYGRSDETMNPKGARFNCSDIYFALEDVPGIEDTVVVSQYNQKMDERAVLFVKILPGHSLTDEMKENIKKTIERHLTHEHVPNIIMETPDIPYNSSGKKLNGVVKKLINKMPFQNDTIVNPSSLDFFRNVDLGEF